MLRRLVVLLQEVQIEQQQVRGRVRPQDVRGGLKGCLVRLVVVRLADQLLQGREVRDESRSRPAEGGRQRLIGFHVGLEVVLLQTGHEAHQSLGIGLAGRVQPQQPRCEA